jgi:ribulose 1,5-bisphosphate synthetase/thiazole synthase
MQTGKHTENLAFDVVVAGGGTAGVVAAVAAARNGMKTLLVERANCLGGTMTSGLIIQFGGGGYKYMTGIQKEILDELVRLGEATDLGEPDVAFPFNPEAFKELALEKVHESGAEVLLYTNVVGAILDGKDLRGVEVVNKSGAFTLTAKVVIDATGDADVVALSGAPYASVPVGGILGARVADIDIGELLRYMKSNPNQICETDLSKPLIRIAGFFDLVERAMTNGDLEADMMCIPDNLQETEGTLEGNRRYLRIDGIFPEKGTAMIGYGAQVTCDGTDVFSLTRGEREARRRDNILLNFLRKYVPGFRNSYILYTASSLAIWGSRKMVGEYVLSSDDIHHSRRFEDVVVNAHANLDHRTLHIKCIEFDIPYRALLPREIENLIVAGRCLSTARDARIPGINIPICMQMGQAAGVAAAMSVESNVSLRRLDRKMLQQRLVSEGLIKVAR